MGEPTDKSDNNPEVVSHDQFGDLTVIRCHGVYGETEDHPHGEGDPGDYPTGPSGRRCGCRGGFIGNPGERCRRSYAIVDAGPGATMICGHKEEYHYSDY
jgi:hypothetical protein